MRRFIMLVLILSLSLNILAGCKGDPASKVEIGTFQEASWDGELDGMIMSGVSSYVYEQDSKTHVIVRGRIKYEGTENFDHIWLYVRLENEDGDGIGGEQEAPTYLGAFEEGTQKTFEIIILEPDHGTWDLKFSLDFS